MSWVTRVALRNAPAMNILMTVVIIVGAACLAAMRRESFPNFQLEILLVQVPYPGATPVEAEEGICQKIEESVRAIEGVKKVTSIAAEGSASVVLELHSTVRDPDRVLDEVRSEIDRIPSFPEEAEDPVIRRVTLRTPALKVGVLGPERTSPERAGADAELELREVAERVRSQLLLLDEISQVELIGARPYQIDIELSEETLRSHGLSLQQVADIVRRENRQLPAGTLRSPAQELLLRGDNRRTIGEEIAELPLVMQPGGAVLTIRDLGTVRDEFADETAISVVNGRPTVALSIDRTSSEDLLKIVDEVHHYVEFGSRADLPPGYSLTTWGDTSIEVRSRIQTLTNNGLMGLVLVFLLLALFLEIRLAVWVAMGIPFSLCGAAIYLYFTGETLNMLSMFGFLMALGIVVDDAIVVGENVFAHRQRGLAPHIAARTGAEEVAPSVVASVLTTVIAFLPLMFVSGVMGKFIAVMPVAIIAMLLFSLVESVTVLPVHLAHSRSMLFSFLGTVFYVFRWVPRVFELLNRLASRGLEAFVARIYLPSLRLALEYRSVFLAGCVALLLLIATMVKTGVTPLNVFPKMDGNQLLVRLTFPDGTPAAVTDRWTRRLEDSIRRIDTRSRAEGAPLVATVYRVVGQQTEAPGPGPQGLGGRGSHLGSVEVELVDVSQRTLSSQQILAAWRRETGEVPGAEELSFATASFGPGSASIEFKLLADSRQVDDLERAVEASKAKLAEFAGVTDITDDSTPGKWELRLRIRDEAQAMGVRNAELAETVRASYYGAEVMRLQRGRHEIKLMVRYPHEQRRSLANLDEIRVRTGDGVERPLPELADVEIVRGYSEINRVDQLRSITVSADVDEQVANAAVITAELKRQLEESLLPQFPGVRVRWEGEEQQRMESVASLGVGLALALVGVFVMLVIEFKSYLQPLIVMTIIPFGIVGAVLGHAAFGLELTLFSLFGVVALSGIVVNDAIVLMDFINHQVRSGVPVGTALIEAGARRFRPVFLTTVTTAAGLLPIVLETSLQAQVLVPMAVAIACGQMFSTVIVLLLLPTLYSVYATVVDWSRRRGIRAFRARRRAERAERGSRRARRLAPNPG